MSDIEQLQERFKIDGVTFAQGNGGLVCIRTATDHAEAEIYLQGAHLTRYQPKGEKNLLFVSANSAWNQGKAIRGGVPVCFPWFGPKADNPDAPLHGFARLREWEVESIKRQGGAMGIVLRLAADDDTRALWDVDFIIRHHLSIGRTLTMALAVENHSPSAIRFEEALHTYFSVDDARKIAVHGLEGATYLDKVDGGKSKTQDDQPIRITAETDRLYLDTTTATTIEAVRENKSIRIDKRGSHSTVVWNPWIAKSKAMGDFGDEEWPGMICVETVNANKNAVELPAGQTHRMAATISLE